MYPFYVLDLPEDATDEQAEARYQTLVRRHPPDRDPERFDLVRRAYEALRTAHGRLETRLFYLDVKGTALTDELPKWAAGAPRRRLSVAELADLLKDGR